MSLLSFAKKASGRKNAAAKPKAEPKAADNAPVVESRPTTLADKLKLTPMITEDSIMVRGSVQTVAFRVHPQAAKQAIALAIAERFGVTPTSVRTIQMWGKKRRRGKTVGSTSNWKKAYVTLPAGKTIDITA